MRSVDDDLAERLARMSRIAAELERRFGAGESGPPKDAHAKMLSDIADALDHYFEQREIRVGYENHALLGLMLGRSIRDILYGGGP